MVSQSIDSLPANSFFTSLATLDTDPLELEVEKLAVGRGLNFFHSFQNKYKIFGYKTKRENFDGSER